MTDANLPSTLATNYTPWTDERVALLRSLVAQRKTWADTARALGLSSPSSAHAAAKRYLGHTPRPYRRSGARA